MCYCHEVRAVVPDVLFLSLRIFFSCTASTSKMAKKSAEKLDIFNYFSCALPNPNEPQIYKEYSTEIEVECQNVPVVLWIVPAQEHYSSTRTTTYEYSKAVILCYAIDNPASLQNACKNWYPEIEKYIQNVPIVLVGNKMDLRSDENTINVSLLVNHLSPFP
ncbi:ras-like GTP-binding protein Rho1 [Trichonephila inaurata madagascariensis]|uniref:Ras-like GTP-binding protein Rho1 n=1 Tax=Trichonephila inaurata madagascariensis TaxID=2747483 RepID=A0A8X6XRG4_9ARAC|nr:ras-like GTP-binding protein Rho1 [Trichonephila inaurata madagascariensis]